MPHHRRRGFDLIYFGCVRSAERDCIGSIWNRPASLCSVRHGHSPSNDQLGAATSHPEPELGPGPMLLVGLLAASLFFCLLQPPHRARERPRLHRCSEAANSQETEPGLLTPKRIRGGVTDENTPNGDVGRGHRAQRPRADGPAKAAAEAEASTPPARSPAVSSKLALASTSPAMAEAQPDERELRHAGLSAAGCADGSSGAARLEQRKLIGKPSAPPKVALPKSPSVTGCSTADGLRQQSHRAGASMLRGRIIEDNGEMAVSRTFAPGLCAGCVVS